jgi:hypothetical protein
MAANRFRLEALLPVFMFVVGTQVLAETPNYKPTPSEQALLPTFCWGQFNEAFSGPQNAEYNIHDCGAVINHYCPGLVDLMRANKTFGNRGRKMNYLQSAKTNTLYTLNGIADYPQCPIRGHVESTLRQIDGQMRSLKE